MFFAVNVLVIVTLSNEPTQSALFGTRCPHQGLEERRQHSETDSAQ